MQPILADTLSAPTTRRRFGIVCDFPQEHWTSMDLVASKLAEQVQLHHADRYDAQKIIGPWKWRAAALPSLRRKRLFFNADRLYNRHFVYPKYLRKRASDFDFFHVADHSYSMQVHALPAKRTGVFCHDLDAYRSILLPKEEPRPKWYRVMTRHMLRGLQEAAVVFYTTDVVRAQIDQHQVIDPAKLVQAPYGVGEFFKPAGAASIDLPEPWASKLRDRRFILHVSSCVPRKRIDVLLDVFAEVRKRMPDLLLVQIGGKWTAPQQEQIDRLGIAGSVIQTGRLPQDVIAEFVRRAALCLLPSEREGFGLPVAETLACGAILVASDIPVLREVGGDAAVFVPLADVPAWADAVVGLLNGTRTAPALEKRFAVASKFTWERHASTILSAYERLVFGVN